MAAKRRKSKRIDEADMRAWRIVFASGFDYLHDLRPYGLRTTDQARLAAREAWARFGADFMAQRREAIGVEQPWALKQFGDPTCR